MMIKTICFLICSALGGWAFVEGMAKLVNYILS